jgi:glycosyltransferase involved in cell wall biosynthesis
MVAGVPVLAARASCLPEVYADAAEYFDPSNTTELTRKMTALLADNKLRLALARRGRERVTEFSWTRMAESTLATYRAAAKARVNVS